MFSFSFKDDLNGKKMETSAANSVDRAEWASYRPITAALSDGPNGDS